MTGPLRIVLAAARDEGFTHFRLLGVRVNLASFLLAVDEPGPEVSSRPGRGEALELMDATGKIPIPLLTLMRGGERGS